MSCKKSKTSSFAWLVAEGFTLKGKHLFIFFFVSYFEFQDRVKRKFSVEEGDHISLVNVFNSFVEVSCPRSDNCTVVCAHI